MAVQVADTLAPKNGLSFPIADGNDIAGGAHTVANTVARDALIGSQKAKAGMIVYVVGDGYYKMNDDMTAFEPFKEAVASSTFVEDPENGDYLLLP